ncbi:MAG: site-specific integrase [Cyclobacteriaceae bacterium]
MKVTLRSKEIKGRKLSLYLDYYPAINHPETGLSTRREFLKMYLHDRPQNPQEREHNKETKMLAEKICSKRKLEIDKGEYGFLDQDKKNTDFLKYYLQVGNKHKETNGTYDAWNSSYNYIERFTKGHCKVSELSEKFCNDYKEFLLTTPSIKSSKARLSQNAALSYFNKFKAALKQAFKDGLIQINLSERIETIRQQETQREYLSLEELQRLAKTECDNPLLKTAALFSSLTGLRWSDIKKLKWEDIQYSEAQGYFIRFTQKKTKGVETLPISIQAKELLGNPGDGDEVIFRKLHYSAYFRILLGKWMLRASITKNITFHSFRHTFATLQIAEGTDIYTVSKMLGHRDLKTTQVYAKIVDQKKREAADKIKL